MIVRGQQPMLSSTDARRDEPMALSTVGRTEKPMRASTNRGALKPLALSTNARIDPRVLALDRARDAAGLSHGELCRRAGVDATNWCRIRKGQHPPRAETLKRMRGAIAGEDGADRLPLIAAMHRLAMILLAIESGAAVESVMAQDFSVERPTNADWLRAAHLRRYAMFVVTVDLGVGNAALARALGCSRQNVMQARRFVDHAIDDPAIDALLSRVGRLVRGGGA